MKEMKELLLSQIAVIDLQNNCLEAGAQRLEECQGLEETLGNITSEVAKAVRILTDASLRLHLAVFAGAEPTPPGPEAEIHKWQ